MNKIKLFILITLFSTNGVNSLSQTAFEYYERGYSKFKSENFKGAISDFTQALELDPRSETYFGRGLSKFRIGDLRGAMGDYNKVIELDSLNVEVYYFRGIIKSDLGDIRGAILDSDRHLEIKPDAEVYWFRGILKEKLENYQGAIEDFTNSIYLNPQDPDAYFSRGSITIMYDKESGCLDLSKAGELGHDMAYELIKEFCN